MSEQEQAKKPVPVQIQLDEQTALGVYVNLAFVNHTETEFVLDMIYLQPQQPKANVRSRLISSPKHTKRLLKALEENIKRYEQRYGEIELSGPNPADEILQ